MKRVLLTIVTLAALSTVGAQHCCALDAHTTTPTPTTTPPAPQTETPALIETVLPTIAAATPQQPAPKSDPPKKRKLDADLSGFDTDSKSDKRVSTTLGGSRSAAVPSAVLLAPKHAKLYGASALFSWTFTGHNEGYVFLLTDEDETQLLRAPTKDPHYLFDPAKAKLTPGNTYYWRVQVLPNTLASDPLEFTAVTAEERASIDKAIAAIPTGEPYEAALSRARVFVDHRLWFDALGAYDELIAKYPNRAEAYEDRGTVYAQLPMTKAQSETDLARAKSAKR